MVTDVHTIWENRSWRSAAIWLLALGPVIALAIWLASLPVVYDFTDQICANDPDRFNLVMRAATEDAATFPPCTQDTILGDEREVTPAPGTKIRIYIGPDGDLKIGTD